MSIFDLSDLSEVKPTESSRVCSTCHWNIRFVRRKENGIITGIFDVSEFKNVDLSRVCSTCHGYIRLVRSKEYGIVTDVFDLSRVYSTC